MAIIEIRDILNNETGETIFPRTHVDAVIGLKEMSFFEAVPDTQDPTKFSVKLKPEYTGLWAEGWIAAGGVGSGGGGGGSVSVLDDISDVHAPNPSDGDLLVYNSIDREWQNTSGLSDYGASLSLTTVSTASYLKDSNGNYLLDSNGDRLAVGESSSVTRLNLLNRSGIVLSSVELDIDLANYATRSWVQSQGYITQQSLSNYVTLDGLQSITGAKTFTARITASGGIVAGGDIYPSTDNSISLGYSDHRFSNGNITTIGTSTVYLKNSTGGNSGMFSASGGWMMIRAGSDTTSSASYKQINFHDSYGFYPDGTGVNLGYTGATNRWANIYGVNEDLSGDLALASTSHIDIGPLRIEYDATNKALHITKKDSNDTENYGLYADGFVAAGGVQQTS